MGMNLNSAVGDFFWYTFSWAKLLRLAERYGWEPAGTTIPDSELKWMPDGRWNGDTFEITNDFYKRLPIGWYPIVVRVIEVSGRSYDFFGGTLYR